MIPGWRDESGFLVPDCGNCCTCANGCVQKLAEQLYDAGQTLLERRCVIECKRHARMVVNVGFVLVGMAVDPACRLLGRWFPSFPLDLQAVPALLEIALWGGQGLLMLFVIAPWYEHLLRKRWSPSRGL